MLVQLDEAVSGAPIVSALFNNSQEILLDFEWGTIFSVLLAIRIYAVIKVYTANTTAASIRNLHYIRQLVHNT